VYEGGATHVGCWAHARRYFFDARLSDPERAHQALARIRVLYAVEREAKEETLTGAPSPHTGRSTPVRSWPRSPTGSPGSGRGCCRSRPSGKR
jgi:hypothetical protein